jgi:hypothetical protein
VEGLTELGGGTTPFTDLYQVGAVLVVCNDGGSDSLPLFCKWNIQKPRGFKGLKGLPAKYADNTKSWIATKYITSQN